MSEIQKLTVTLPPDIGRVETGPVQFNDDWPGTFIRGDNAAHYAAHLSAVIKHIEDGGPIDVFTLPVLKGLLSDLQGSNLRRRRAPVSPGPFLGGEG